MNIYTKRRINTQVKSAKTSVNQTNTVNLPWGDEGNQGIFKILHNDIWPSESTEREQIILEYDKGPLNTNSTMTAFHYIWLDKSCTLLNSNDDPHLQILEMTQQDCRKLIAK